MDADVKKLKKLVKFMRSEGVLSLKTSEIELSLSSSALFPDQAKSSDLRATPDPVVSDPPYSQEDALFWSSAGVSDSHDEGLQ